MAFVPQSSSTGSFAYTNVWCYLPNPNFCYPHVPTGRQTLTQVSKGLPWVSEFEEIIQVNADTPVPANARALSTPAVGHIASAKKKTLGVYRTPEEFIH